MSIGVGKKYKKFIESYYALDNQSGTRYNYFIIKMRKKGIFHLGRGERLGFLAFTNGKFCLKMQKITGTDNYENDFL